MRLSNKTAIITGGGGDIGRAAALKFVQEGAKQIAIVDVDEKRAQETVDLIEAEGAEAVFIYTDMTSPDDVKNMIDKTVEQFGEFDILFNNAGVLSKKTKIPDVPFSEWERVMDININGVFLGMKYAIPHMKPGSSIINTASIAGIKGQKLVAAYSASKSSVIALTKTAATEFGRSNIRVNAIAPGVIDTQMSDEAKQSPTWEALSTANALRRVGQADEIANLVLFLASDESSFITGETIVIDGGTLNL